ncbi:MAG TPA: hypothetical protein VF457_10840, partial [Burkholderiaceae bacterium]
TADAANGLYAGEATAAAYDGVYDATLAISATIAQGLSTSRMHALDGTVTTTNVNLACPGGGTVTISISGGTAISETNGQFDAGEVYTLAYTGCIGATGWPALNGNATLTVNSAAGPTNPATAVTIVASGVSATLSAGTVTVDGTGTVSRTSLGANGSVTETSTIASDSTTLTTSFNGRGGSVTLTGVSATDVLTRSGSTLTGWQFGGQYALSGTANGRSFDTSAGTDGLLTLDTSANPVSGDWTVTRSDAILKATVAAGSVTLTADEGSDGTIDSTWTFPTANLTAAAG